MKRETSQKFTFIGLGLLAINLVHRDSIADWMMYSPSYYPTWYDIGELVKGGWAITAATLVTLVFAYLWAASENSN